MTRTATMFLAIILLSAAAVAETEWDGRLSIRSVYSEDSDTVVGRRVFLTFIDVDLLGTRLTPSGLALELDSTFIWDDTEAKERRFGQTESIQRIRRANLSHHFAGKRLRVAVGRSLITESGNAWVDGLQLEWQINSQTHIGGYGGLRPLPLDFAVNTDYQTTGVYAKYRQGSRLEMDGGYNLIFRDGLDRQFVFQRSHFRPNRTWSFFNYATFDATKDPEFSTLLGGVHVRPMPKLTLSLNVSRYAIEQYRNAVIFQNVVEPNQALILGNEVINLVYNRARLSISYRFLGQYYAYQMLEVKHRSQDGRQGALYTMGVRDDDFFGLSFDIRSTVERGYQSDTWLVATQLDGDLGRRWSWEIHSTTVDSRTIDRFTERGRTFDEAQRIYLIGGVLHSRIARLHHLSLIYDFIVETELQDARNQEQLHVHTGMFRYQMRF